MTMMSLTVMLAMIDLTKKVINIIDYWFTIKIKDGCDWYNNHKIKVISIW